MSNQVSILERCVCLVLERHYLGNHRKVKTSDVVRAADGDADKVDGEQVKATKRLIDTKALLPCNRALADVYNGLRKLAIPSHNVFGKGTYLVPFDNVAAANELLSTKQAELAEHAADLAERYAAEVDKQEQRLGPKLFNRREYPTKGEVREAYSIDWNYFEFNAPEKLQTVDRAAFERSKAKHEQNWRDAVGEARLVLRETCRRLVADLVEKLETKGDGKKRRLHDTALDGLTEFVAGFDRLNIAGDGELKAVVDQLRDLTDGLDVDQLRDAERFRAGMAKDLGDVSKALGQLVEAPRRGLRLGKRGEAA